MPAVRRPSRRSTVTPTAAAAAVTAAAATTPSSPAAHGSASSVSSRSSSRRAAVKPEPEPSPTTLPRSSRRSARTAAANAAAATAAADGDAAADAATGPAAPAALEPMREPVREPVPEAVQQLRRLWQFAGVSQFLHLFRTAFKLGDVATDLLEGQLANTLPSAPLLDIVLALLRRLSNARGIDAANWAHHFRFQLRKHEHLLDADARAALDAAGAFRDAWDELDDLDLRAKVAVLHGLCEWQLDASEPFRALVGAHVDDDADAWRVSPVGWDRHGATYYLFDDNRLYCDALAPAPKKRSVQSRTGGGGGGASPVSTWSTVCVTIEDWTAFPERFAKSKHVDEAAFYAWLTNEALPQVLPVLRERQREVERQRALLTAKRSNRLQSLSLQIEERDRRETERRQRAEAEYRQRMERIRLQREARERNAMLLVREERLREWARFVRRRKRHQAREAAAAPAADAAAAADADLQPEQGEEVPVSEGPVKQEATSHGAAPAASATPEVAINAVKPETSASWPSPEPTAMAMDVEADAGASADMDMDIVVEGGSGSGSPRGPMTPSREASPAADAGDLDAASTASSTATRTSSRRTSLRTSRVSEAAQERARQRDVELAQSLARQRLQQRRRAQQAAAQAAQGGEWYFDCDVCGLAGRNLDDGEAMVECGRCGVWGHLSCAARAAAAAVAASDAGRSDDDGADGGPPSEHLWRERDFVCANCARRDAPSPDATAGGGGLPAALAALLADVPETDSEAEAAAAARAAAERAAQREKARLARLARDRLKRERPAQPPTPSPGASPGHGGGARLPAVLAAAP
ncbi:hypothetical protein CXG81DRAFT_28780, partial [Caulochytrium protostelioides]